MSTLFCLVLDLDQITVGMNFFFLKQKIYHMQDTLGEREHYKIEKNQNYKEVNIFVKEHLKCCNLNLQIGRVPKV